MTATAPAAPAPVLLDTNVFSKVFVPAQRDATGQAWATALAGRTVVIAVQTAVELRAWPLLRSWGLKSTAALEAQIASVSIIPVNDRVQSAYVDLTVWAKKNGHGIYAKNHSADRWIAASAMSYALELASTDAIFKGIQGLARLTL